MKHRVLSCPSGVPALEPATQVPSSDGRVRAASRPVRRHVQLPDVVRRTQAARTTEHEAGRRGAHVCRAPR